MIHKDYDDDDQGYKLLGTEQERYTSQKVNYKITLGHFRDGLKYRNLDTDLPVVAKSFLQ